MDSNKMVIIALLLIIIVLLVIIGIMVIHPFKTETLMNITSSNELNADEQIYITLTDKNGTPLNDQIVNVTLISEDGSQYSMKIVTDGQGCGVFVLGGLFTGKFTVNAIFGGSDNFLNSSASQEVTIKEESTQSSIDDLSKYKTRSDTSIAVMPSGDIVGEDAYGDVVSVNGNPNGFF